jgi:hypothetical protein
MIPDKRQHPRYAIELDAVIFTDEGEVAGRTQDLSRGGFCMLARQPIAIGAQCRVRLALVFSENQFSEHLELLSTVVWCTKVQGAHQLGVKFGAMGAQSKKYLELFIRFLDESSGEEEEDVQDER